MGARIVELTSFWRLLKNMNYLFCVTRLRHTNKSINYSKLGDEHFWVNVGEWPKRWVTWSIQNFGLGQAQILGYKSTAALKSFESYSTKNAYNIFQPPKRGTAKTIINWLLYSIWKILIPQMIKKDNTTKQYGIFKCLTKKITRSI